VARRPTHLFWGIVALLVGAYFGYLAARTVYIAGRGFFLLHYDLATREWVWFMASFFPLSALAAYCIWMATRQLQRAGGQQINTPKVRWGRFVLGLWIIFTALKSHLAPGLNVLRPDNAAQALGMSAARFVMVLIGIVLMCLAFKPKSPEKEMPAETLVR
jgi:hypothetical protein